MSENSALSDLVKKLEQRKQKEFDQIKQIEVESMSELAKSLKASLRAELSLIEKSTAEQSRAIEQNFINLNNELMKIKSKQWIIPTIMGISIALALALGTWGVTKYLSSQLLTLQKVKAEIVEAEKTRGNLETYQWVVKTYKNGIEVKTKPDVWQKDGGTWLIKIQGDD